jgi:hypothetical protein
MYDIILIESNDNNATIFKENKKYDLYIVSDENLCINDWYYYSISDENGNIIDNYSRYNKHSIGGYKIIATTNQYLIDNGMYIIDDEFIKLYKKKNGNVEIENIQYEMTNGWYPTYNDPDNSGCIQPAEPTGIINILIK